MFGELYWLIPQRVLCVPLVRFVGTSVAQIIGGRLRMTTSLDEALTFLRQIDPTLPPP